MVCAMRRSPGFHTIGGRDVSRLGPPRLHRIPAAAWREDSNNTSRRCAMKWERPAATDLRFGFEITMYIANR